ncbi:MAG: hydrogenase maturation protein [Gammaproteobacteria bacterium]|nr:hydrogenase maturation protein [Gammaproteobacteria bacterium]
MLRILFLTHAFNSLTQRLYIELQQQGHEVSVEFDINDTVAIEAVNLYQPDLIIAPFLKRAIPESIWKKTTCLIVHPGIAGDRGPSALDWAIINNEILWGVTVLQANEEMDAGDIWATQEFMTRHVSKASLYRNEVTEAATLAVLKSVKLYEGGSFIPQPLDYSNAENLIEPRKSLVKIKGQFQPLMTQTDRKIHWYEDTTETVLRKIRSADGFPGVLDDIMGREFFLYDAHEEQQLRGKPGELIAYCGGAICRATTDGAVWIGHLRDKQAHHPFKLPATHLLEQTIQHLPEIVADQMTGYRDIWYEQEGDVGYLHFPFYNGAMGTEQCQRLHRAYIEACQQKTKVIVLMGGADFWSNGMHLNLIEAAQSAADESWNNINAINDLALEIINTNSHLTIAALQGNAGAGGVFLARAVDEIWASQGVILNPHYKDMGNLYGSEYWTYLLPRYAGQENAERIIQARLPIGTQDALSLGLINEVIEKKGAFFVQDVKKRAADMADVPAYSSRLEYKRKRREVDEQYKPLAEYRKSELDKMHMNFFGFDPSYHIARYNFVYKVAKSRTPLTIALHRRTSSIINNKTRRAV